KLVPSPLSIIQQPAQPIPAEVPAELSQVNFDDPVDVAILQAQLRVRRGEDLYNQGALKRAKEEFDSAVDLILETAGNHPTETRLQRELQNLVARVSAMELAALHEGDGFTDESDRPAAIDDLEQVETFPALIDPKLKKTVEDEVQEIAHDLPIEINDRVLGFLGYYQNGKVPSSMNFGLERVGRDNPLIEKILKEEAVLLDWFNLSKAERPSEPT